LSQHGDRIKRLSFLASKRGFLEVELVLRPFAAKYLENLDEAGLDSFEALLNQEDLDIWEIICGRRKPPPEVGEDIIQKIRGYLPAGFRARAPGPKA
jgi:antitoxin CptB